MVTETEEKPEIPEQRGKPLCPSCLAPHEELDKFCPHCRVPLGPYAMNLPLEGVEAQGWMYRRMAHPRTWKEYLTALMLFGPSFVGFSAALILDRSNTSWYFRILLLAGILLFLAILVRTTWNFAKRPPAPEGPEEDSQEGRN